jgi:pimeloyl-ACP methyl ester carboxylesterase
LLSIGSQPWDCRDCRGRIAMQLPRPDDLTWRTAGLDIRHARKETYRCGGSAQNPRGTMPSRQNRLCVLILLAAVALAALAVSSALAASPASARSAATVAVPRLVWHRCASPKKQGFQCATARVPLDYSKPRGATIHLAVIRHRASDRAHRIGTLFFNPGGPGGPGAEALPLVFDLFPAALRERFDIASWDPRGVGASTAVQCFATADAEQRFFRGIPAGFPVGAAEIDKSIRGYRAFGRRCERRNGGLLRHVSTADTARDLNLLRGEVGDRRLSYWGVSYGSFLGATYANLFPKRVRAIVVDGDVNPKAWVDRQIKANAGRFFGTWLRQRSDRGSAKTLNAFLDLCGRSNTAQCAFSAGSPAATRAKFETLLSRLRTHPESFGVAYAELVETTLHGLESIAPLGPMIGWTGLASTLQQVWMTGTMNQPAGGKTDDFPPISSGRIVGQDPRYAGPEQQFAIFCSESANPRPGAFRSLGRFAFRRSGPVGPWWSWASEPCGSWPATAPERYAGPWDRRTHNPVLVIGNTYDPNTPHRGARAMTRQLSRARLLTVDGYGHTELLNPSSCANRYASRYLIAGVLPPKGTRCKQDQVPFRGKP